MTNSSPVVSPAPPQATQRRFESRRGRPKAPRRVLDGRLVPPGEPAEHVLLIPRNARPQFHEPDRLGQHARRIVLGIALPVHDFEPFDFIEDLVIRQQREAVLQAQSGDPKVVPGWLGPG